MPIKSQTVSDPVPNRLRLNGFFYRWRWHLLMSLFFLGLVCWLFGRTLIPPEGTMLYGGDVYDAYYYWKGYLQESVRFGVLPYWNPYNFSGTPFLAHPNINIGYLPNWLFILLPLEYAFSWYFALHVLIAAGSMYVLARLWTTPVGAIGASVVYAFGGFFAARIYSGHLEYVDAASWVPLAVALSIRLISQPSWKNMVHAAGAVGVLLLAGNELFFLFTLEILGLYILFFLITTGRTKRLQHNLHAVIAWGAAVAGGIGLAAVGIVPRLEFISQSIRAGGVPYELAASGSLPWNGLLLFLWPFYWGNPFPEAYSYQGPWPNVFEFTHYIGILPFIVLSWFLCAKGVALLYRRISQRHVFSTVDRFFDSPGVWFFFSVVLIFVAISLGANFWIDIHRFLWEYTPLYKGIRFPARHLFVVFLALSVLTGIALGQVKHRWIQVFLIGAMLIDLLSFDRQFIRHTLIPTHANDTQLIETVTADTDLYRVLPDFSVVSPVRRDLDFGGAVRSHVYSTSDYNSMVLGRYYQFIDILNQAPQSSLLQYNVEIPPPNPNAALINFLNVRYVVADKQTDSVKLDNGRYVSIMEGERYRLYKNTQAAPRFFLVHQGSMVHSMEEMERALRLPTYDATKDVVMIRNPDSLDVPIPCDTSNEHVTVKAYTANSIRLDVTASCDAFLSSSEVYYPGWKATLDGKQSHIYLSNYAFRSLFIPAGHHEVEFVFVPMIFYKGVAVSGLTLLTLGAVMLYRRYYATKKT